MMYSDYNVEFLKKYFKFKGYLCGKYMNDCKQCPLYESTDGWPDGEEHSYVDNCKFDFEERYIEDILKSMDNSFGE